MKIDIGDTEKLEVALKDAQKRARIHLLGARDIQESAAEVDKKLDEVRIAKVHRQGTIVIIDPYRVCSSYRYSAATTQAVLERGKEKWFLVDIGRVRCRQISYGSVSEDPEIHIPLTRQLAGFLVRTLGFIPFWKEG